MLKESNNNISFLECDSFSFINPDDSAEEQTEHWVQTTLLQTQISLRFCGDSSCYLTFKTERREENKETTQRDNRAINEDASSCLQALRVGNLKTVVQSKTDEIKIQNVRNLKVTIITNEWSIHVYTGDSTEQQHNKHPKSQSSVLKCWNTLFDFLFVPVHVCTHL